MKSETISELAKALTNFQGKMTAVKKDAQSLYKYAQNTAFKAEV